MQRSGMEFGVESAFRFVNAVFRFGIVTKMCFPLRKTEFLKKCSFPLQNFHRNVLSTAEFSLKCAFRFMTKQNVLYAL